MFFCAFRFRNESNPGHRSREKNLESRSGSQSGVVNELPAELGSVAHACLMSLNMQ
jgi:hypothetical protein